MALVIIFSVCGAFTTRPKLRSPIEYFWNGSQYVPTSGTYGVGFYCLPNLTKTCTYILSGPNYIPYRTGDYVLLPGDIQQNKDTKDIKK